MAIVKLNSKQIKKIRKKYKGNWGDKARLGREFGVTAQQIANIVNYKSWRNIK